jgi:hypothetical protein
MRSVAAFVCFASQSHAILYGRQETDHRWNQMCEFWLSECVTLFASATSV